MNAKKILAIVLASIMVFSTLAFASTETPTDLPTASFEKIAVPAGMDLDYAARFVATDDSLNLKYENYHVDFELTLSNDATVVLAGQYDSWSKDWITLVHPDYETDVFTKEGTKIEGNKPFRVCYDGLGGGFAELSKIENPELTDKEVQDIQDGFVFSYRMIYNTVKSFNCGIKFAEGTPNGTTATLKLFLYEKNWPDDDEVTGDIANGGDNEKLDENGVKYQIGKTITYTYETFEPEATATDAEIVEKLNSLKIESLTRPVEDVVDVIKSLPAEAVEEIKPEVIKTVVELGGQVIDTTAPAVYTVDTTCPESDDTISVEVEADVADNDALDSANITVYDVNVECTCGVDHDVIDVPVLVSIPVPAGKKVAKVLHDHNGVIEPLEFVYDEAKGVVCFAMSKFSQVGLEFVAAATAGTAVLGFEAIDSKEGEASFNLVLEGAVENFVSGEFYLQTSGNSASFDYDLDVVPANTSLNLLSDVDGVRKYEIHLNNFDKNSSWSAVDGASEFVLAKLTVRSYGSGAISVLDNGLLMMKHDDSAENLAVELPTVPGQVALYDIVPPMNDLTIKVAFNNNVVNTEATYQDMLVKVYGGDLEEALEYKLGKDVQGVVFDAATCTYTIAIKNTLTENVLYNIEVTGAGYRTARYSVNMRTDKTVNFWNNVKDVAAFMDVSTEASIAPATVNYLAGDIVKDNIINIYDLSAVVSYFGEENLSKDNNAGYAKYDLNRDGKIDSKDVAYVLVSWNK